MTLDNMEDVHQKLDKITDWQREHEAADRNEFQTLRTQQELMELKINDRPTKDEMKEIVHTALIEFFTKKGLLGKNILITMAVVIGALVVIGGGFKWLLGLIGFSYIGK